MKKALSMRMFFTIAVVLGAFFITGLSETIQAAEIVKWRCQAYWPNSSSSFKDSAVALADKIKERTNGRFIIEVYPGSALVPATEVFNSVKRGMIQIGSLNSGYALSQVPVLAVANGLPMAFNDPWEAVYFHKWMGYEKMLREEVAKHGMYWATDKANATELTLKKKIATMADFKGLKLRSSGLWQKYLTLLGAAASYIPAGEIYASLSSGVVDGLHYGAAQGAMSMKLYEVNKFHLKPAIGVSGNDGWVINQKAMDQLPKDIREILISTLEEHFLIRTNQYTFLEERTLSAAVRDNGVEVVRLSPAESQKMRIAAVKIWDEVAARGPACAKAVQMVKEFNRQLGRNIE